MIRDNDGNKIVGTEALNANDFTWEQSSNTVRSNRPTSATHNFLIEKKDLQTVASAAKTGSALLELEFDFPTATTGYKIVFLNLYLEDQNNNVYAFDLNNVYKKTQYNLLDNTSLLASLPQTNITNEGQICRSPIVGIKYTGGLPSKIILKMEAGQNKIVAENYILGGFITSLKT